MFIIVSFACIANATIYVVPNGSGTKDGSSWNNAMGDIQSAINAAKTTCTNTRTPQEVWIAAGTYSTITDKYIILMKDSVSVYGGFAGTETSLDQRAKGTNPWDYTNETILNGGNTNRCVESAAKFNYSTIMDGFTITNGNGVGKNTSGTGGGIILRNNFILQNCIVKNNSTTGNGGGVGMYEGGTLRNCMIKDNTHTTGANGGGGVFCNTSSAGFVSYIENCEITGNSSTIRGAGIGVQGNYLTYISNCKIYNNKAIDGTTLKPGAAIYANSKNNQIVNCVINNNTGTNVIYHNGGNFTNNTVVHNEGIIFLASATNISDVNNNIIVGNVTTKDQDTPVSISVAASYPEGHVKSNATWPSVAYQSWGGLSDSILTTDVATAWDQVAFVTPTSFKGVATTDDQLTELSRACWEVPYTSYCVDTSDNSLVPSGITTDFIGNPRIAGSIVDAGAYELPYYTIAVTLTAGGKVNGNSSGFDASEPKGKQVAFTITPNSGYKITRVKYNGEDVKDQLEGNVYTTPELASNGTLDVTFDFSDLLKDVTQKIICYAGNKSIELRGLSAGEEINVFSITGVRIMNNKAIQADMSIPVTEGIYIVKVSNQVKKIVVK